MIINSSYDSIMDFEHIKNRRLECEARKSNRFSLMEIDWLISEITRLKDVNATLLSACRHGYEIFADPRFTDRYKDADVFKNAIGKAVRSGK